MGDGQGLGKLIRQNDVNQEFNLLLKTHKRIV